MSQALLDPERARLRRLVSRQFLSRRPLQNCARRPQSGELNVGRRRLVAAPGWLPPEPPADVVGPNEKATGESLRSANRAEQLIVKVSVPIFEGPATHYGEGKNQ
jgi:hypothetical protein